jgi:Rod binding domain-containing protein
MEIAAVTDTLISAYSSAFDKPPTIAANAAPDYVRRTAEEFEGFFLSQMFEMMFADIKTDGLFGGGQGEKIFRSLLVDEYAKSTVSRGGVGIADNIVRQLLANQEVTS